MLSGWKGMNMFDRYILDFQKLWNSTLDEERVRKIKKFRTWYEYTQDIHGKWYLEAVDLLFRLNLLAKGELVINGKKVLLKKIKCSVTCITGDADDITLEEQCTNLIGLSSSKNVNSYKIPNCGHIGVFMGTKSQEIWKKSLTD